MQPFTDTCIYDNDVFDKSNYMLHQQTISTVVIGEQHFSNFNQNIDICLYKTNTNYDIPLSNCVLYFTLRDI